MAFLALRETVRELMRQVTRGGTPAGLQLMIHCRDMPVAVSVPQFFATLRRTMRLREEDELLLHAFLDPFDTGSISWKEFIDWVRRPAQAAADGAAATERRVRRTMETCLRVCAALRRKLVLTRDGDYDFATTFRHVAQRTGSTHAGSRQAEHFISYFSVIHYVRRCVKLTPTEARYLLGQMDADRDGAISLKDFTGFMLRHLRLA